jgi:hypothetical protein
MVRSAFGWLELRDRVDTAKKPAGFGYQNNSRLTESQTDYSMTYLRMRGNKGKPCQFSAAGGAAGAKTDLARSSKGSVFRLLRNQVFHFPHQFESESWQSRKTGRDWKSNGLRASATHRARLRVPASDSKP